MGQLTTRDQMTQEVTTIGYDTNFNNNGFFQHCEKSAPGRGLQLAPKLKYVQVQ